MSVNLSLIVLKKMYDILMIFVEIFHDFGWFFHDMADPADPADQNETDPDPQHCFLHYRIRNTAFYTTKGIICVWVFKQNFNIWIRFMKLINFMFRRLPVTTRMSLRRRQSTRRSTNPLDLFYVYCYRSVIWKIVIFPEARCNYQKIGTIYCNSWIDFINL